MPARPYTVCVMDLQDAIEGSYTVPEGFSFILRDVTFFQGAEISLTTTFELTTITTGATIWWFGVNSEGNPVWQHWEGRQQFNAGDGIKWINLTGIDVRATGYLFET